MIARSEIASVEVTPPSDLDPLEPAGGGAVATTVIEATDAADTTASRLPYEEVTIPAGTVLPLVLEDGIASDSSQVEDRVRARLRDDVTIDGVGVIREGSVVLGSVTEARRSERVEGQARVAVRFHTLKPAGASEQYAIRTGAVARQAPEVRLHPGQGLAVKLQRSVTIRIPRS